MCGSVIAAGEKKKPLSLRIYSNRTAVLQKCHIHLSCAALDAQDAKHFYINFEIVLSAF